MFPCPRLSEESDGGECAGQIAFASVTSSGRIRLGGRGRLPGRLRRLRRGLPLVGRADGSKKPRTGPRSRPDEDRPGDAAGCACRAPRSGIEHRAQRVGAPCNDGGGISVQEDQQRGTAVTGRVETADLRRRNRAGVEGIEEDRPYGAVASRDQAAHRRP